MRTAKNAFPLPVSRRCDGLRICGAAKPGGDCGPARVLLVGAIVAVGSWAGAMCGAAGAQQVVLMRGAALSEAEGAAKLDQFAGEYSTADEWRTRAERIRAGVRQGAGLAQLPPATDLNPIRHSRREMDGYTVENMAFEALPGYYVTGNLYLPTEHEGELAGVLCPFGHWTDGRFRADMQLRCAALARMGAAVFTWDMIGFGEADVCDHRHSEAVRLQLYRSMRAVDFLLSLGFVDEERLAVTGASGGGTQSFLLAAADDRIDVSVPVVMVSAHFYGGCACESGMPVHVHQSVDGAAPWETNNVEIAASIAPKPLLIVSDGGDWTKNAPEVEFPYIRRVYELVGAADNAENAHFPDEGHDYGASKRAAVYPFLAKHLGLDLTEITADGASDDPERVDKGFDESFVTILPEADLHVFNEEHPKPQGGPTSCDEVLGLLNRR